MCPHWLPEVEMRGPLNEVSVGVGPGVWQEAWPKGGLPTLLVVLCAGMTPSSQHLRSAI